jgi:hypothetical protein
MRLNFWQILGIVLVIVAAVFMAWEKMSGPAPSAPPATQGR